MADEELIVKITVQGDKKAQEALNKTKDSSEKLSDSSKTLASSTSKLGDAFMKMVPGGSALSSKLKDVGGFAEQLGLKFGMSSEAAAGLSSTIAALGPVAIAAAAALAAITAAAIALGAAIKLAVEAAPLESIQLGFDVTAARAGAMGDEVLAAMQKASGGMVSMEDLMRKFNDASMLVSPDFALQLSDAMEPLQKVAAVTGESMDYLVNSFVTGVGRLSKPILDNLRVTVDTEKAYAQYARTLGKATDALTKQEQQMALANYTIEQLKKNTAGIPSVTQTAAGIMASFTASAQDLRKALGLSVLPILTEVLRVFGVPLRTAMQTAARGFRAVGNALKNTLNQPEVREALDGLSASMSELFGQSTQAAMKIIVAMVTDFAKRWAQNGPKTIKTITEIVQELNKLAIVINRVLDAANQLGLIKTTAQDLTSAAVVANATVRSGETVHSGGIATYASGTPFHPGGMAIVGERGPELVNLPRGSSVSPNGASAGLTLYGDLNITTNADSLSALMLDIERAAKATV